MSEAVDHGITVTELAAMDQTIDVSRETTAAFVGRALRGPLNTPVLVGNFGEFRRRFGDIWPHSSLGPAVKQFFEHGGQRLFVVRVSNNARAAMVCLPASGTAVVLRAVEPGSTEQIRAAVDYDATGDDTQFNLTLQRVDPLTGVVRDQEMFRKLSYREDAENFVGDALLGSSLARLEHPYPTHRPEATSGEGSRFDSVYVGPAQSGTDGIELTDYDLIGSRKARTGLFALEDVENFDLLYLPPLGRAADVGPTAILAAELYCRHRGAMLIIDPRADWSTAGEAAQGVRDLGYASPNMLGYFPRVFDRSTPEAPPRHAGGAIAGLLSKNDRSYGAWRDPNQQGLGLTRNLIPAADLGDEEIHVLNRAGLNVLAPGPAGRARLSGSVTMGRGVGTHRDYANLPARRFCLQVINTIATAARWAVFEADSDRVVRKIRAQVLNYLAGLDELGAFVDSRYSVRCDASALQRPDGGPRGVTILLMFHPIGCEEAISLTLQLTPGRCRVGNTAFAPSIESAAQLGSIDLRIP